MWICLPLKLNQLEPKTLKASWKAILRLCITVTGLRETQEQLLSATGASSSEAPARPSRFRTCRRNLALPPGPRGPNRPGPPVLSLEHCPCSLCPPGVTSLPLFFCSVAQASCNMALHPGRRLKGSQRGRKALQPRSMERGPCQLAPYPLPSLSHTQRG